MDMKTMVSLITGSGARRVGWHVANTLARRGSAIAVHYHTSERVAAETVAHLRGLGVEAEAFGADLADEAAVLALVSAVVERFGRIDVLAHCAARWGAKRLEETTAADLRREIDVNLVASFLVSQRVGLQMAKQVEGGAIVLLGDWACARPYEGYAAYFASKGGIPALVRTMAVELSRRNPRVRVNGVLPGPVMLPEGLSAEDRAEAIAGTLVKREGTPGNIAQAVVSLVENDFITGVCLPVDGGRTIQS
jgi:pteridine reductase